MFKLLQTDFRGKHITSLEGESIAMLKGWALLTTKGKQKTYIYDNSGLVTFMVLGMGKDNFPTALDQKAIEERYGEIRIDAIH